MNAHIMKTCAGPAAALSRAPGGNRMRIVYFLLFSLGISLTVPAGASFRKIDILKKDAIGSRLAAVSDCPDPDIRAISYQAYRLTGDAPEPGVKVPLISIEFPGLTLKQFSFLKETYGKGLSDIQYREGEVYRLEDFLPPVMQALMNHQFLPEYRTAEDGSRQLLYTNCYLTAYAVARAMTADGAVKNGLSAFTASQGLVKSVFEDEALFEKLSRTKPTSIAEPGARFGDIILHKMRGGMPGFLDHVRVYVDKDLYFEKTGPSRNDTYALTYFQAFNVTGTYDFEYIRPRAGAALPPPGNVFRETAYASETDTVFREGPLNIFDVPVGTDHSGRARLPGKAYAPFWGVEKQE